MEAEPIHGLDVEPELDGEPLHGEPEHGAFEDQIEDEPLDFDSSIKSKSLFNSGPTGLIHEYRNFGPSESLFGGKLGDFASIKRKDSAKL